MFLFLEAPGGVAQAAVGDKYDMDGELHDFKLFWTKQYLSHSRFWVYHSGPKSRLLRFTKDRTLPTLRRQKAPTAVS